MYAFTLPQDGAACSLYWPRYKIVNCFRTESGDRARAGNNLTVICILFHLDLTKRSWTDMAGSDRPDRDAAKKSRACVPCHERKVRCNASLAGLPCNRCIESGRIGQCRLVSLPDRSAA